MTQQKKDSQQIVLHSDEILDDHVAVALRPITPREKAKRVIKIFERRTLLMLSKILTAGFASALLVFSLTDSSGKALASDPTKTQTPAPLVQEVSDDDSPGVVDNLIGKVQGGWSATTSTVGNVKNWTLEKADLAKQIYNQQQEINALRKSNVLLTQRIDDQAVHGERYNAAQNCVNTFQQYLQTTMPVSDMASLPLKTVTENK